MKNFSVFVLSFFLALFTCNAVAATANGTFNYDFASDVACSATVTTDCITRFEIWDITSIPTRKLTTVPLPATISTTQPQTIPFTFKIGPPYGSRTWSVQAVTPDNTTSDINAPQAQKVINVKPGAPSNLTGTL